ncbi:MAG TPA: hypothetical protein VE944_23665 [Nostoc sp.]|uniref:hypothetical protein n=1 Tax=Nostoc sp. TaxID=1180 RepID=UPI002D75D8C0|nr:hypothetical protein [Nostoc sp.]HYX17296.1 hypothetical protein [Nostoc sp.]
MSQEADILRGQQHLNRHLYQQRIADAAEALFRQVMPTAYTGFDAELGLARLKDANGNIFYGAAQTNGAVGKGENIRLRRGGVLAKYDEMPHRTTDAIVLEKSAETYNFIAFVGTKAMRHDSSFLRASNNFTVKLFVGFETQTISIAFYGLLGGYVQITYPGGEFTTEKITSGIIFSQDFIYTPTPETDGYIECSSPALKEIDLLVVYQIFYYLSNGEKIIKLPYQINNQRATLPDYFSVLSYTKEYTYITFKETDNNQLGGSYNKITIITTDKKLNIISTETFENTGESTLDLPNNKDWRKSLTHSFLANPPDDEIACINSFRADKYAHIDLLKRFISTGGSNILSASKLIHFKRGKFNPSQNSCSPIYQSKTISTKIKPEVAKVIKYCDIAGVAIYV